MKHYEMRIMVLSPVHIGTGEELMQDIDFAVYKNRTFRLDQDVIGEEFLFDEGKLVEDLLDKPPGQLLKPADYARAHLFRYVIPGRPRSTDAGAIVRECIKTVDDRPYLPGSSIKGALRTALAWVGWDEVNPTLDKATLGRQRSWAGQRLERQVFGPDPYRDLLRALHVGDATGPGTGEGLMLANAQVVTKRELGSPIEVEAIKPETQLSGRLSIDDSLFTEAAERELKFGDRRRWLDELPQRANAHAQARIKALHDWFASSDLGARPTSFYRELQEIAANLPANRCLLQLGWGSGWDGKTFWTHLQGDPNLFEWIIDNYRMTVRGSAPRRAGDPFPRSRRALVSGGQANVPFGWILVEFEPASHGG